jgi:translation initiation factor 6
MKKQFKVKSWKSKSEEHIALVSFNQNTNIGMEAFVTNDFCLLGTEVDEKYDEIIEKVLKVPVHRITIAGTSLIGIFLSGTSKCVLVPSIAFDYELKELDKLKINYKVIDSKITALGNAVVCNDNGAYLSDEFKTDVQEQIKEALDLPIKEGKITEVGSIGSLIVVNNKGGLIHPDAESFEINFIQSILNIEIEPGTVNMGSPYVKSGILCNDNGILIGDKSGGPEASNADKALGFLDK